MWHDRVLQSGVARTPTPTRDPLGASAEATSPHTATVDTKFEHESSCQQGQVAQLMGHANVDTTLNVYTQVLDGSLRAAVDKVGGELFTIVH
jgi:hypothetical protein